MQSMLRSPGDRFDRLALPALARCQPRTDRWAVPIGPSRLGHDAPQVRIAGLADRAALHALTAGVLARDNAGIAHELACTAKARELPELSHQRHRRDLRYPAQALQ